INDPDVHWISADNDFDSIDSASRESCGVALRVCHPRTRSSLRCDLNAATEGPPRSSQNRSREEIIPGSKCQLRTDQNRSAATVSPPRIAMLVETVAALLF